MYTISILILLKIYQTRHPDINANAYSAFGVLAFIIFIGVIGVLHGNMTFWVIFTVAHCISCLVLSFQVSEICIFIHSKVFFFDFVKTDTFAMYYLFKLRSTVNPYVFSKIC